MTHRRERLPRVGSRHVLVPREVLVLVLLFVAMLASSGVPSSLLRAQQAPQAPSAPATSVPAATPAASPVRSGFLVRPDSVAVGDPFLLVVSVVVPNAARVEWPAITDTAAVVAMRAPVRVETVPDGVSRRETATYELAAWDVGPLPVGLPDATVRHGTTVLKVPLGEARVFVRSVLPGDTTLHVPKPAKALFPREVPWWERWWPAFAIVAALLLLWWYLKRRRDSVAVARSAPVDVFARALHDFDRLDRLALSDAGERGRAVALAIEILRVYLVSRIPTAALSLTSSELLDSTRDDGRVPVDRLAMLLSEADAIKFARHVVQNARAKELTAEARQVVERVEEAHRERLAAEEARRLAAERAAQATRESDEDDARRRSRRKEKVS